MKKIVTIFLAVIMVFSLASCQATPDELIVVKKDEERMLEKAENAKDNVSIAQLQAPTHCTTVTQNNKGTLNVTVDAQVNVPSVDKVPMYQVKKGKFTQDMADKLIEVLLKGNTLYMMQYSDEAIANVEKKLAETRRIKANGEDDADYAEGSNIDTAIAVLEQELNEMRAGQEKKPAPTVFGNEDAYEAIEGTAEIDGTTYYLRIANSPELCDATFMLNGMGGPADFSSDDLADAGISLADAENQAQELLNELGAEYMSLTAQETVSNGNNNAWRLRYARNYGGIGTNYTDGGISQAGDEYSFPWENEYMEFLIDKSGIICFRWREPYAEVKQTMEDSRLIAFDKVMTVFENMIVVDKAIYNDSNVEIAIDRIELGMMRIRKQDSEDIGVIIPVWDFFGTFAQSFDGSKPMPSKEKFSSHLTINAIDGSIINRNIGY